MWVQRFIYLYLASAALIPQTNKDYTAARGRLQMLHLRQRIPVSITVEVSRIAYNKRQDVQSEDQDTQHCGGTCTWSVYSRSNIC